MRTFNLVIVFLLLIGSYHAQFQEIFDFVDENIHDEIKDFKFKNEDFGIVLKRQQFNGRTYLQINVTEDGGLSWQKDTLKDVSILHDCMNITDSDIIYFSCVKKHWDENNQLYYTRGVYKSINKGVDWTYHPIDTPNGQIRQRNLVFINDSVGMFSYQAGVYLTTDYAETWTKVKDAFATPLGKVGNTFTYRRVDTVFFYDPYLENWSYTLSPYNCYCSTQFLESKDDFVVESFYSGNGGSMGYPFANFPVLQYSTNFSPPEELHFMSSGLFLDVDIQENRSYLLRTTRLLATEDWINYYELAFLSDSANFNKISFVNDTIGYAISHRHTSNGLSDYRLWKTTNGGGNNWNLATTVNPTASVSELEKSKVVIYPNPTAGIVHIKNTGGETIQVINSTGKVLLEIPQATTIETIDLSSFASGIYFVHVAEQVYKVIKN